MHGTRKTCVRTCVKNMILEGGTWSLWRGNGINVLKIAPESALKFMAYEQAKKFIRSKSSNKDLTILQRFLAGSIAGSFSQTVIYPMEVSMRIILMLYLPFGFTGLRPLVPAPVYGSLQLTTKC